MVKSLKKVWSILLIKEKILGLSLLISAFVMAISEISSIGSIFIFSQTLTNTESNMESTYGRILVSFFNVERKEDYILLVGILALILLASRNIVTLATTYLRSYFANMITSIVSIRLLVSYHSYPWSFFLNNNTSVLKKNVLQEPAYLIGKYLSGAISIVSDSIVTILIVAMLIYYDAKATIVIGSVLSLSYFFIYSLIKDHVSSLGQRRFNCQEEMYRSLDENLDAIKEIKVFNGHDYFIHNFSVASNKFYKTVLNSTIVTVFPKPVLEIIIFGIMILAVLLFLENNASASEMAGFLTLYGVAGYRLIPLFDRIFHGLSGLRFSMQSASLIVSHLNTYNENHSKACTDKLDFNGQIKLVDIKHKYDGSNEYSLHGLSMTIPKNNTIGIIGHSGSGKTTIANILIGLLKQESGDVIVDCTTISDSNLNRWRNNIGYVSQDIYLLDKTIKENVAFGIPVECIDDERVIHATRIANIHDFITNDLPNGYSTLVGERGIRLSGGQKQRLAIARALYNDPDVLILDEATSALDGITEKIVSEAIDKLANKKTIIIIAHRFSTIKSCDQIYMLNEGSIVANGSYEELEKNNERFQSMNTN